MLEGAKPVQATAGSVAGGQPSYYPTVAGLPGSCENFCPTTSKSSPIYRPLNGSHWATSVVMARVVGGGKRRRHLTPAMLPPAQNR